MFFAVTLFWSLILAVVARPALSQEIDFARDVRPILADKCYACHGPDQEQRQGGDENRGGLHFDSRRGAFVELDGRFAIVPGRPDQSEMIRRINSSDINQVMPPRDHPKKLTSSEKQLLADWIRQGAIWKDHWAYVPPQRHPTPETIDREWPRNLVDFFIRARLEQLGLRPSPTAAKNTLLRRLSFDLVGLPPSPGEVEAFVVDDSPEAYERAVDRLLNSPHYGERMAMYWLDLVRYADTVGYHGDQNVSVSPYRDYVINAFNDNMPFDQFTREQLAGDLLNGATREQLVASGYNRLGMMSAEGGVQPKEYLAKYASDRVRTASAVWLGSTLGCSECHDHKFDPFTTQDFYSFASFFADVKERGLYSGSHVSGKWGPQVEVPAARLPELLKPIDRRLAQLKEILDTPTPEMAAAQQGWENERAAGLTKWEVLKPENASSGNEGTQLKLLADHSILASGRSAKQDVYTVTARIRLDEITGFRVEVLPHESLPKNGPGRAGNGNFVITEFRVLRGSGGVAATHVDLQNATATIEQTRGGDTTPYGKWSALSVIDGDVKGSNWGWAILPQVGQTNNMVVETSQHIRNQHEIHTFIIEQNHTNPGHTLGRFRISATSSPRPLQAEKDSEPPEDVQVILAIAADKRDEKQSQTLSVYYRSIAPALAAIRKQLEDLKKQRQQVVKAGTRTSLITVAVEPRTMRVLSRGNWMDESGEVVQPRVPHFLRQIRKPGRANRLDLAEWITSRDNPLTARVFVNRLWKLFFGTGFSKVLDDVGAQGETPTHLKLLDTLSAEFMDSGWNVKQMIKLLVLSNTYRQSSLVRDDLAQIDPYNRLLARQSRFRMDAEMIRDNALAVSGLLVRKIGGRSVKPYQPSGLYRHLNFPRRTYQADSGQNQYRRGLYTHWQRQFLHPAMKAFDAPPREECAAERPRSNTPLAALVLLNDPSYVEAARVFAQRAIKHGGGDRRSRLQWMIQQALTRNPNEAEIQILTRLLQSHLEQFKQLPADAEKLVGTGLTEVPDNVDVSRLAAWSSVARTICNMHEFITRN